MSSAALHDEFDLLFESRPVGRAAKRSRWDRPKWARKVRARDGHVCQSCGGPGEHAHHIVPVSVDPGLELELSNGKTLCGPCHLAEHQARKEQAGGDGSPWHY